VYNPETDLLFPPRVISALSAERGDDWKNLVAMVEKSGRNSLDETAFVLIMARMNACSTCNADSFRAMNGCTTCARQSLKRFRGSDAELIRSFQAAKIEVELYIQKKGR
jgi:predicted peroxiredoxin